MSCYITNATGRGVKKVSAQAFKWILLPLNTDFAAHAAEHPSALNLQRIAAEESEFKAITRCSRNLM